MQIVLAAAVLGGLGLIFGLLLTLADKKFHVETDPRVEQVRKHLSGANCGACGYPGCDACAEAIVKGEAKPNCCAPGGQESATAIAQIMGVEALTVEKMVARVLCQGSFGISNEKFIYDGYRSCRTAAGIAGGPKTCANACLGLGDCVEHCSFDAISLRGGIAHVDENLCMGCGTCIEVCPRSTLRLMPVDAKIMVRCRNNDSAKAAYEACMRSCIGCGRCAKTCRYQAITVENGLARVDTDKCTLCGECVNVCPRKSIVML